jgi:septal ring factor EnvC (AmiA/AmiB activator)
MLRIIALLLAAAFVAGQACAQQVTEIWKCKGRDGRWTYTNDRNEAEKLKCEVVTRQVNVAPAAKPPSGSSSSANFPKESAADRANARDRQRQILEKELATEQSALAKAQQDLAAQEQIRNGDERNYARVQERLQPFKDSVETHEKNIEALRRELGNLYR